MPVAVLIALATLVVWTAVDPTGPGFALAMQDFVAVLVIACPCALGLATIAEVRPEGKGSLAAPHESAVTLLRWSETVSMTPTALAGAHVGIAVGSGTDIAVAVADIPLLHGGITRLPTALRLAKRTRGSVHQNLFWPIV